MAFDLVLRHGTVLDGSGRDGVRADVAIVGDSVAAVRVLDDAETEGAEVIDVTGMAVTPGFINVLSHSYVSLLVDPRGMSEVMQGVTTQIFGEGHSMGPLNDAMHDRMVTNQGEQRWDVPWRRLSEYLAHCEARGVAQNVASFVGATTLRVHAIGHGDRPATAEELDLMRGLVAEEMADGALGIGTALIYPPGFFASTDELVELCRAAAPYGGSYISHLRSEGDAFEEAVEELLTISRRAEVAAEVYHLKAAGPANWPKMERVIERLEQVRSEGQPITADVYTYTAGSTALRSAIPPRFHDGGMPAMLDRLRDPARRSEMRDAIESSTDGWENLYLASGGAEGVLVLGVDDPSLRHLQGRTIAELAAADGVDPVDALLDLVERAPQTGAAYFIIDEDNLRRQLLLPWLSFGSDAAAMAAEGRWLDTPTHPRAYGNFARLLGTYVRGEGIVTLPEAVRRLAALPAENLGLARRGQLREGWFADIAVFDPATIADTATYAEPHQYAVGMHHVVVNGRLTMRDGRPTGVLAGRALKRS